MAVTGGSLSETKMNSRRIRMMAGGAVAIFFTGFPHVWSVFQPYVMEQTGWSQSMASVSFYLVLAMFVVGNVAGGRIQDSGHHALAIRLGAVLMAGGVLLSSISIHTNPLPFYLTYGVMQGLGQGMLYATVLSTAQKWFPDRRGFASGLIVTANGLCGLFMAPLGKLLLKQYGPQTALLAVGGLISVACILCTLGFAVPKKVDAQRCEKENTGVQTEYTSRQMMQTGRFYLLLLAMFAGLLSYFFVSPVSQSYQIEKHIVESVAVSAVMLGSVMNALTRLVLPILSDKIGRVPCIQGILLLTALAMGGIVCQQQLRHYGVHHFAVWLLWRYHGQFSGTDKLPFRPAACRRKLRLCDDRHHFSHICRTCPVRSASGCRIYDAKHICLWLCSCCSGFCMYLSAGTAVKKTGTVN